MLDIVCAWCGKAMGSRGEGDGISHGICSSCAVAMGGVPLDGIVELEQAEYDRLPIGVIELDQAGVVLSFNAHQAQRRGLRRVHVVGQRFFEDVAPCTQGPAFQGRFDALVASGEARSERFEFIFRFATGDLLVKVAMASDPSRARVVLLINDR